VTKIEQFIKIDYSIVSTTYWKLYTKFNANRMITLVNTNIFGQTKGYICFSFSKKTKNVMGIKNIEFLETDYSADYLLANGSCA